MKNINMITGQMFRLQLSAKILNKLIEAKLIDYEEGRTEKAMYEMAKLFKEGVELEDFQYEFRVTDLDSGKTYVA